MGEISLSADQIVHFNRVNNEIAPNHPVILNTSQTGAGKTIDSIEFIRRNNIKRVIIVCNNSLQYEHWNDHCIRYQIPAYTIITYDTLRGTKTYMVNGKPMITHGLLYKIGDDYEPTETFMLWVEEGLILICDECHLIKNECGRSNAVKALSRYITIRSMTQPLPLKKSWSLYLSMTPFDQPEHTINFVQVCGIMRSDELYDKVNDRPKGIMEIYNYCNHFEPSKTANIWGTFDVKSKNVHDVAYRLIYEILLRLISSFAKNCHVNYLSKQSVFYAYFDILPEGIEMMKRGLDMITTAPNKNKSQQYTNELALIRNGVLPQNYMNGELLPGNQVTGQIDKIDQMFNSITLKSRLNNRDGVVHGMITTQTVKTFFSLLGFIDYIFKTVANSKVVVFLSYKEAIDIIMRYLPQYGPVKITGDVECTDEVRNSIRARFNEPNLNCRLIIIISQIGSDCIELDDKHGGFPRIGLGFPDFYHSRFFQCPGRLFRRYTKSNSLFFWCLVNSEECPEESVFKSINSKSKTMEETLQNNEIIPPIYYEKIVNPHTKDLNQLLKNAGVISVRPKEPEGLKEHKVIKITKSSVFKTF